MGKSKRNRKKNQKLTPQSAPTEHAATVIETSSNASPLSKTAKTPFTLIVLATIVLAYWLMRGNHGEIQTSTSELSSSGISSLQTGGSQPVAPSGLVDLQPTGNATDAGGGIQAGQSL